jgi:N-acetylglucosaminyldiphosphoundecaprenol N-acetyl-beta-D-mannosaminyltransferase
MVVPTPQNAQDLPVRETADAPQTFSVLGMPVQLLDDYPQWLCDRAERGLGTHVVTLNAEMTMQARSDRQLAQVLQRADLAIPDGSGIVFYLQLRGQKVRRTPGIELAESMVRAIARRGESVFFLGGAPGVADRAVASWRQHCPELTVAGCQHGYLKPEDEAAIALTLQRLQPKLILVGMGVPRQEFWIDRHRHLCPQSIWIGVGGSFDIWAGLKVRAPRWIQRAHLEWAYRLYQEPWRWRRMLALPHFAWLAAVTALTEGRS